MAHIQVLTMGTMIITKQRKEANIMTTNMVIAIMDIKMLTTDTAMGSRSGGDKKHQSIL